MVFAEVVITTTPVASATAYALESAEPEEEVDVTELFCCAAATALGIDIYQLLRIGNIAGSSSAHLEALPDENVRATSVVLFAIAVPLAIEGPPERLVELVEVFRSTIWSWVAVV